MKKGFLKKLIIGILVALGLFVLIIMILPEDEEEPNFNRPIPGNAISAPSQTASVETSTENDERDASPQGRKVLSVGSSAKSATIMVYVNGSDLESEYGEATEDISEMISSGIGSNVNVVLQTMGTKKWKNYGISSKTAQTWTVADGKLNLVRDGLGQLDCTSKDTLSEFIGFCKDNYPAERYFFLFWNHGGGPVYGFGYDEWQAEDASLTLAEMSAAFAEHKDVHFDIIGMDCCIMASLETCYAMAPYCKYALLSEDFESGLGWSYNGWMKSFEQNPGISTTLLGKYIVDDIISSNESESYGDSACIALFNVSAAKSLYTAWKAWAYKNESALLNQNYSREHKAKRHLSRGFWDMWDSDDSDVTLSDYYISDILAMVENIDNSSNEAKGLTSALKASVAYYGHTSDKNELTGMAVSLPYGDSDFYQKLRSVYGQIGLDSEYINWLENFVSSSATGSYYNYDSFDNSWGGWSDYENDYGCNYSNGGSCQYSWDYGWGDDWYDDSDYDDGGFWGFLDDISGDWGYDYDSYSDYDYGCDRNGYADDWIYDYESELWYYYDQDALYLYDDESNTMFYYDEDNDDIYYYDESADDWYLAE
ncbi:MAG: hypothetical protein K6E19_01940 [Lachnospiraceae bacterium]|nr:hypothetical protein [Lachnospiraceae bacterium]